METVRREPEDKKGTVTRSQRCRQPMRVRERLNDESKIQKGTLWECPAHRHYIKRELLRGSASRKTLVAVISVVCRKASVRTFQLRDNKPVTIGVRRLCVIQSSD